MQYKKLFTIPFIALSLFSTACAVQSGNVVGKESVYPPVAAKTVFTLIIGKIQWNTPRIIIAGVMVNGILLKIGKIL